MLGFHVAVQKADAAVGTGKKILAVIVFWVAAGNNGAVPNFVIRKAALRRVGKVLKKAALLNDGKNKAIFKAQVKGMICSLDKQRVG